jgi:hypothetical protein
MRQRTNSKGELIATRQSFRYSDVATSLRKSVQDETAAIRRLLVNTANNIVQIGLRLKFVRNCLGRHAFQGWLKAEFQWSQPVASNFMRAAEVFSNVDCLDHLQPSALYVLARRKAPEAARAEALERARRGETITKSIAETIVCRHNGTLARRVPAADRVSRIVDMLSSACRDVGSMSPADRDRPSKHLATLLQKLQEKRPAAPH